MHLNKIQKTILITVSILLFNRRDLLSAEETSTVVKAKVIAGCDFSCTPINFGNIIYMGNGSAVISIGSNGGAAVSSSTTHRVSGGSSGTCTATCSGSLSGLGYWAGNPYVVESSPLTKEGSSTNLITDLRGLGKLIYGSLTLPENVEPGTYTGTYTVNFNY